MGVVAVAVGILWKEVLVPNRYTNEREGGSECIFPFLFFFIS